MPVSFVRLRIAGFKSFAEPAVLEILPGLTGVVGPNGCGKSNVVEALRWAMGENSARSLRGGEMDDVIFAGTANRASRNLAEVTISLEDAAGVAPPPFHELPELQVSRRIERGAGSTYRVNNREARARDVQTLFADLASGARASAMVSQGRVSSIVNARPEERRSVLEEAAGITGLHARRHEAELKLRQAEANLERAEDLRGQLESQLDGLRRQARQAARFRAVNGMVDDAERELFALARARTDRDRAAAADALAAAAIAAEAARTLAARARDAAAEADADLPALRTADADSRARLERARVLQEGVAAEVRRAEDALDAAVRRRSQIARDLKHAEQVQADAAEAARRLSAEAATIATADADHPRARPGAGSRIPHRPRRPGRGGSRGAGLHGERGRARRPARRIPPTPWPMPGPAPAAPTRPSERSRTSRGATRPRGGSPPPGSRATAPPPQPAPSAHAPDPARRGARGRGRRAGADRRRAGRRERGRPPGRRRSPARTPSGARPRSPSPSRRRARPARRLRCNPPAGGRGRRRPRGPVSRRAPRTRGTAPPCRGSSGATRSRPLGVGGAGGRRRWVPGVVASRATTPAARSPNRLRSESSTRTPTGAVQGRTTSRTGRPASATAARRAAESWVSSQSSRKPYAFAVRIASAPSGRLSATSTTDGAGEGIAAGGTATGAGRSGKAGRANVVVDEGTVPAPTAVPSGRTNSYANRVRIPTRSVAICGPWVPCANSDARLASAAPKVGGRSCTGKSGVSTPPASSRRRWSVSSTWSAASGA